MASLLRILVYLSAALSASLVQSQSESQIIAGEKIHIENAPFSRMGVSLEAFRARIGLFAAACTHQREASCSKSSFCGSCGYDGLFSLNRLPTKLLCLLLLLASGIEPNPGPEYKCEVCGQSYKSAKNYFLHCRIHLSVKHSQKTFKVSCMFEGCSSKFSSCESLKTHLARKHQQAATKQTEGAPLPFCCPVLSCSLPKQGDLKSHLEKHLDLGQSFVCPYSNCSTHQKSKVYFRTHISRYHKSDGSLGLFISETVNSSQDDSTLSCNQDVMDQSDDGDNFNDLPECKAQEDDPVFVDLYPPHVVRDEVLRFYYKLEGVHLLPSTTVQAISEEIALLCEMSHLSLKKSLMKEMVDSGIDKSLAQSILSKSFTFDPVYNIHHKHQSMFQVSSTHLRKKFGKQRFPYVEPEEVPLGYDTAGKPRYGHYVSVRETLQVLINNEKVKSEIMSSFSSPEKASDVVEDFKDGSAFKEHKLKHENGKCLQLIFFQDAFEFSPFGPAKGLYKSLGVYFVLGNLSPEYRSKVDMINLAFMIQERDLKPTEEEYFKGVNKFEMVLKRLLDDLQDLQVNGIQIDNDTIPVCLLFFTGDNLGSHQIGSFVQSFNAMFTCRYCPISKSDFKAEPYICKDLRTPGQYDEYVTFAKRKWDFELRKAFKEQLKRKKNESLRIASGCGRREGARKTMLLEGMISKSALKKLHSINYRGVKPLQSALNKIPGFHVSSPALPPCIAHDLFEGCINIVLPQILKHFIVEKQWFTLETLNRRIKTFKYQGSDAADAPNVIKSFSEIKGHACENWTLLRLLPFIIGDLILDQSNPLWQLYLKLKLICEYVCAPKITLPQVAYLKSIIGLYLCNLKEMLPSCLTPKHHYLAHYPDLIAIFGPLIRLFTMRFESKHAFFKAAGKACKNFINITSTLANKYQYRFAYDHSLDIIPPDVKYDSSSSQPLLLDDFPHEVQTVLQSYEAIGEFQVIDSVVIKGLSYKKDLWMVIAKENTNDLSVGCIESILCSPSDEIYFILKQHLAENTFCGFYMIENKTSAMIVKQLKDLPDYYPLPAYSFSGKACISLKHSVICS